jgi:hypothetical protein
VEAGVARQWHVHRRTNAEAYIVVAFLILGFIVLFALLYVVNQGMLH